MTFPRIPILRLAAGAVFLSALTGAFASEAFMRAYGPKSLVKVSKPTLMWEIWPGAGSSVTGVKMTLDGRSVDAKYDPDNRVAWFKPDGPLAPGTHSVSCDVTIDDSFPVHKDWQFVVAGAAIAELPGASTQEMEIVDTMNEIRRGLGLPDFLVENRLCAAASAHVNYLRLNKTTGHNEKSGQPGFIGAWPADRLEAYGFLKDSWEDVDYGSDNASQAIQHLFNAPYHRIPFMQPGSLSVGASYDAYRLAVEFEMSHDSGVVVSPYPGQREFPTTWNGQERPNPLRMHPSDGSAVGSIIVFAAFTPDQQKLTVRRATLVDSEGRIVPTYLNTPENDDKLTFASFLIPQSPLKPGAIYTVSYEATLAGGQDVSKKWSFSTAESLVDAYRKAKN